MLHTIKKRHKVWELYLYVLQVWVSVEDRIKQGPLQMDERMIRKVDLTGACERESDSDARQCVGLSVQSNADQWGPNITILPGKNVDTVDFRTAV